MIIEESIGETRKEKKSECINKIINDHSVQNITSGSEMREFPLKLNDYVWCQTTLEANRMGSKVMLEEYK